MLSNTATKAQSGNPIQMVQARWQRYHLQFRELYHCLVLGAEYSQGPKAEHSAKEIFSWDFKMIWSWGYYR